MGLKKPASLPNIALKGSDVSRVTNTTIYTLNTTASVRQMTVPYKVDVKLSGIIRMSVFLTTMYGNSYGVVNVYANGVYRTQFAITSSGTQTKDFTVSKGETLTFILSGQDGVNGDNINLRSMTFKYDLDDATTNYLEGAVI